jgi:hypothetical protein
MTAAQELFEALKNAKPGPNYQAKETPAPRPAVFRGPMVTPLTPGRVELPALGGCVELLYEDSPRRGAK